MQMTYSLVDEYYRTISAGLMTHASAIAAAKHYYATVDTDAPMISIHDDDENESWLVTAEGETL